MEKTVAVLCRLRAVLLGFSQESSALREQAGGDRRIEGLPVKQSQGDTLRFDKAAVTLVAALSKSP
jgi:hypothetical protein